NLEPAPAAATPRSQRRTDRRQGIEREHIGLVERGVRLSGPANPRGAAIAAAGSRAIAGRRGALEIRHQVEGADRRHRYAARGLAPATGPQLVPLSVGI